MRTIWKYPLLITGEQDVDMPTGAVIVALMVQGAIEQGNDVPAVWAEVDPETPPQRRRFLTFGTGHPIAVGGLHYVGSYQLAGGAFVGHVYEQPVTRTADNEHFVK